MPVAVSDGGSFHQHAPGQRRRLLGRIFRGLDALRATHLVRARTAHGRVAMLSAGGPGSGTFWTTVPTKAAWRFTNTHWVAALRARIGALHVAPGTLCRMPRADEGEKCGKLMSDPLVHPFLCDAGPARLRPHRALVATLRAGVEREGAWADIERPIPELFVRNEDGSVVEAIMDVVTAWPGAAAAHRVDVTVRCPWAERYLRLGSSERPGVAASTGDKEKLIRYGPSVLSLCFESNGQLSVGGCATLAALAADARDHGRRRLGRAPGINVRTLRVDLEAALLRALADDVLLSLGSAAADALQWRPRMRCRSRAPTPGSAQHVATHVEHTPGDASLEPGALVHGVGPP